MDDEQLLKWNNHGSHLLHVFRLLRRSDQHADVSLFAGGKEFVAHKVVLSACSDYFASMLLRARPEQAPIIFLDLEPLYMHTLLDYMYMGEVQIKAGDVTGFLEAAQKLKIKGLWIDPTKVKATPEEQFQKTVRLGIACTDFMAAQFALKQPQVNNTFRRSSKSPPPKRKRTSSVGAPAAHLKANVDPIEVPVASKQPSDAGRALLPNGGGATAGFVEPMDDQNNSALENTVNHLNVTASASAEVNPLPLVKIEMEESVNEEENVNGGSDALNGQGQHELKFENDADTMQDPLTVDDADGTAASETSTSPDASAAATQVHEYLASDLQQQLQQQQQQQQQHEDDLEEGGDVSSDEAELPPLVVNEDNPDQAQAFECQHCHATLANANLLRRHVEDKHKQMRKHLCNLCTKAFKRKEHLERHVRIHTGDKPFGCDICYNRFTQKEHLKGHVDNVHKKKKTTQRRNVKIAPAILKAGTFSASEGSGGMSEQKPVLNGPVSGSLVNGNVPSSLSVLAFSSDAFVRGGKKLLPRVSDPPSSAELGPHRGLLGRMVGSSGVVANSIGGAMSPCLTNALNMLATTASAVAPQLTSSSAADTSGSDDLQFSSRNSSPPSLTSPTTLTLSSSNIPFTAASFAGSIFPTTNFPNLLLSNTTNSISSTLLPTITTMSPLNSIFSTNLPNTTFSTSPNAAFQNQDGDTVIKELRINSTTPTPPSSRGSGRGRGRGALARRGKTSKLPRVSVGRGAPESRDPQLVSPPSALSMVSAEGGSASNISDGNSGVTALCSSIKLKSPSSAEKHIKKVVLNYH